MKALKILLAIVLYTGSYSQNVTYDTTFGTNGVTSYCNTGDYHQITFKTALQSNGKIINVTGDYWGCFGLIRFNTDGSLDTSFGTNGSVTGMCNQFSTGGFLPQDIVIQSDDKILIIGTAHTSNANPTYWVARLLPDGALDTSFNDTGYLDVSLGTPQDRSQCIAFQPDGKILLGGTSGSTAQYFTMIRLTTTGAFDTTFGTNGVVQTLFPNSPQSWGTCIAVQPDGKLVMGGYAQTYTDSPFEFAVARYMPNGALDTTFGTGGMLTSDIVPNKSDKIANITLQPDGKIIAIGIGDIATTPRTKIIRYMSNGIVDNTFGNNGIVTLSNSWDFDPTIVLQLDNKIIVTESQDSVLINRLNHDGSIDSTLVTNDFLMPLSNCISNTAVKALIQPNGKILIGGGGYNTAITPYRYCTFVLRLNPGELGVADFTGSIGVVYPNPTTGVCILQLQDYKTVNAIAVYDMMGRGVYNNNFNKNSNDNNIKLDLTGYPSGVYLVEIKTSNGVIRNKVVKE